MSSMRPDSCTMAQVSCAGLETGAALTSATDGRSVAAMPVPLDPAGGEAAAIGDSPTRRRSGAPEEEAEADASARGPGLAKPRQKPGESRDGVSGWGRRRVAVGVLAAGSAAATTAERGPSLSTESKSRSNSDSVPARRLTGSALSGDSSEAPRRLDPLASGDDCSGRLSSSICLTEGGASAAPPKPGNAFLPSTGKERSSPPG
mmetsp:Transcript_54685/g.98546  ORF Transcript_54685/g.98546 Transcript_54685/m.98546 type:complete len:204 (-) Transcript_54685:40-651(-)